ncbi:LamG domain-containing protein [Streptacidiphilus melanogenes]|uniref:LamG domain-containing protein n=1 Tax=Streptacidiphilus melanogenes TaxID=411235 RepID=UPI0005A92972|nr:LamG domain-containing protein [Streptacidiphilus melanogenes]
MSYGGYQPPPPVRPPEPDWNALADRHDEEKRRNRLRLIGGVGGAFLLGAVVGGAGVKAVDGGGGSTPVASASQAPVRASASAGAAPSASASAAPAAPVLKDSLGGVPLTYAGGAHVRPGNGSRVLWLDGSPDAYATAPGPVVDTAHSFTVSAWVLLKQAQGAAMVLSQGAGGYYTFALGRDYWPGHHGWVFKVQTRAGNSDAYTRAAYSPGEAKLDSWVFLTGTYDAGHHTLDLYVNGKLADTSPAPGIWQNDGALQLGRIRYKNVWGNNWDGAVAHVQIWDQALSASQVAAAVHDASGVKPVHSWLVN